MNCIVIDHSYATGRRTVHQADTPQSSPTSSVLLVPFRWCFA